VQSTNIVILLVQKKYSNVHDAKQLIGLIQQLDDKVDVSNKNEMQLQDIAVEREVDKIIRDKCVPLSCEIACRTQRFTRCTSCCLYVYRVLESQLGPKPKKPKTMLFLSDVSNSRYICRIGSPIDAYFGVSQPSSGSSLVAAAVHSNSRGGPPSGKSLHGAKDDSSNGDDGSHGMDVDDDKTHHQQQHHHPISDGSAVEGVDYSHGAPIVIPIATQVFTSGDLPVGIASSASHSDGASLGVLQEAPFDLVSFIKSLDWQGQNDVRDETVKIVQDNGTCIWQSTSAASVLILNGPRQGSL